MKKFRYIFLFFFFGNIMFPLHVAAQKIEEPDDDLGNVSDAFQENFFEALKQKGIENYELALVALKKAENNLKKNPGYLPVVQFEKAKNQKHLKQYDLAEENLLKVIASQPDNIDVIEEMYDLYYLQRDYVKAIPIAQKLATLDEDYKEDLANLYHRTKQYDKSLVILDELDDIWGESTYRNALRRQIYRATGDSEGAIKNLETKIDKNPKKEQDYLNLIFLYSEEGETEKAFETARLLLKNQPKSELVHLALYKFYLDAGNTEEAMKSMNTVFKSSKIENKGKFKVLTDFLGFASKNPQYDGELDQVIKNFGGDDSGKLHEELGGYYAAKGNKEIALTFYEKGAALDDDNFSLIKNTLLLQIDLEKHQDAANLSLEALSTFPAQPLLYLLNGVANNKLTKAEAAIESLEMGVDFLLDNPQMEKDFYEQLELAYTHKGNSKKAKEYAKKVAAINISN